MNCAAVRGFGEMSEFSFDIQRHEKELCNMDKLVSMSLIITYRSVLHYFTFALSCYTNNQINTKSTSNRRVFWKSMHPPISVFCPLLKSTNWLILGACCQPINVSIKCHLIIYLFVKCMSFQCGVSAFKDLFCEYLEFVLFVSKNDINQMLTQRFSSYNES